MTEVSMPPLKVDENKSNELDCMDLNMKVPVSSAINDHASIRRRKDNRVELFEITPTSDKKWLESLLENHFLFKNFHSDEIKVVAGTMVKLVLQKGELLLKEGTIGEHLYACQVGVLHVTQLGMEKVIDELQPGRIMGELGFLFGGKRAASVVCAGEKNVLWELNRKDIPDQILNRMGENLEARMKLLLNNQVFVNLDIVNLRRAAAVMEEEYYKDGDVILLEGDLPVESVNDKFYSIASGRVKVTVNVKDGVAKDMSTLEAGEWFGEIALLHNVPRSASIISVADNTMCYTLSKSAFIQVVSTTTKVIRGIATRSEIRNMDSSEVFHRHKRDADAEYLRPESLYTHAVIGEGGFSLVKMVEDKRTGKTYALKVMNKHDIIVRKQQEHVNNERAILESSSHPFIMSMVKTFQDRNRLFMLLELVQGGELFSRVCNFGGLPIEHVRFYAACVTEGVAYLHRKHIVYRDLKLENLVIGADGYLKIIDFGFAKILQPGERAHTLCGTPDYLAPEAVARTGHWHPTDVWSIGVLIFEMLTQCSPFAAHSDCNAQAQTFRNILQGHQCIDWFQLRRACVRQEQYDLTRQMLQRLWDPDPTTRITCNALKLHIFFVSAISWIKLREKTYEPPWSPHLSGPTDTRHFEVHSLADRKDSNALYFPSENGDPFSHW